MVYAIEECNFEVVQLMRDYIFLKKYEKQHKVVHNDSTPNNAEHIDEGDPYKNLLSFPDVSNEKYTPNRTHYNYDVTSPYYINITHRRNKPQPLWPSKDLGDDKKDEPKALKEIAAQENAVSDLMKTYKIQYFILLLL